MLVAQFVPLAFTWTSYKGYSVRKNSQERAEGVGSHSLPQVDSVPSGRVRKRKLHVPQAVVFFS